MVYRRLAVAFSTKNISSSVIVKVIPKIPFILSSFSLAVSFVFFLALTASLSLNFRMKINYFIKCKASMNNATCRQLWYNLKRLCQHQLVIHAIALCFWPTCQALSIIHRKSVAQSNLYHSFSVKCYSFTSSDVQPLFSIPEQACSLSCIDLTSPDFIEQTKKSTPKWIAIASRQGRRLEQGGGLSSHPGRQLGQKCLFRRKRAY